MFAADWVKQHTSSAANFMRMRDSQRVQIWIWTLIQLVKRCRLKLRRNRPIKNDFLMYVIAKQNGIWYKD